VAVSGRAIVLDEADSVAVAVGSIEPGPVRALGRSEAVVEAIEPVPAGHKLALRDIDTGSSVIKYGLPIGRATRAIPAGSWVHEHNLGSALVAGGGYGEYRGPYAWLGRERAAALLGRAPASFWGFRRADGRAGTRNELWVVPTVGCVNGSARTIAEIARSEFGLDATALEHPYGCSQLGGDLEATRRILARLALNPNAAAAIIVSLGCENNTLESFKAELAALGGGPGAAAGAGAAVDAAASAAAADRIAFFPLQEVGDETVEARRMLASLAPRISAERRVELPLSELVVGLKCGGSDGLSGITANPVTGRLCELLVAAGARAAMTEVPEMFGAEEGLLERCASREAHAALSSMLSDFKDYYASRGLAVYENPSPGNREGGITTLEEKSLGCVRKAGAAPVEAVLPYGGAAVSPGLSLVAGPGNDLVSATALAAAGAQVIVFTTGRGTPFGTAVPTIKVSSSSSLAARKPGWIDFDSGRLISGSSFDELALELLGLLVAVASGERTKAELGGHRGIAIFKDGVTL
jgi:altronate hydrolase